MFHSFSNRFCNNKYFCIKTHCAACEMFKDKPRCTDLMYPLEHLILKSISLSPTQNRVYNQHV